MARHIRLIAAFAALLQTIALSSARAAEAPTESSTAPAEHAAEMFRKGLAEYDAHRYREAIDIFSRVYEQTHAPALLFNIAQAWRLLGECPRAVAVYDAFVVADPTSPDVDRARDWLNKMQPCRQPAAAATESADAATVSLSSPPTANQPAAAQSSPPQASLSLHATASPTTPSKSAKRPLLVGILGGAAMAFAGTGAFSAWRANDLSNQVTALYASGGTWNRDAAAVQREGERAQVEAIALFSAAVLTGVAAYLVHRFAE